MPDDCIFCAIADRTASAEVVEADEHSVAFLDINPATRGHTLVIPRNHSANLLEISAEDIHRVVDMAQGIAVRMTSALGATGVNLINSCGEAAWQTVFHFHMHVVPRYDDDPLTLPWVPAPASSEDLARVAEQLR
ncbi:MAG: HIT family protein [Solirubrobacterales bacterium]